MKQVKIPLTNPISCGEVSGGLFWVAPFLGYPQTVDITGVQGKSYVATFTTGFLEKAIFMNFSRKFLYPSNYNHVSTQHDLT